MGDDIRVREATESDVGQVRGIFEATYSGDYPYQQFLDTQWLKRSVYNDDVLMLVAEDTGTGAVLGTASVVFDVGSHSDLLGELGRLAVHPDARGLGVGRALMQARVEHIEPRLHVGIVQNRAVHTHSQRISKRHGFAAVGFLPMKYALRTRESASLWCRLFGDARELRSNHPRVVPEAAALAHAALTNCGIDPDVVVDDQSASYPPGGHFVVTELARGGMPALLRIERGRVRNRELFGPMRLHDGFFHIHARRATYLVATDPGSGAVAGAVGFIRDPINQAVQICELVHRSDAAVRAVLDALLTRCAAWGVQYVETDVSAHAPRMQRTLLELGFGPVAFVPAGVFAQVERLDVVKMARLTGPLHVGPVDLVADSRAIADLVLTQFEHRETRPRIAHLIRELSLFDGLREADAHRVAGLCEIEQHEAGACLFAQDSPSDRMYVILQGAISLHLGSRRVGELGAGDILGEVSLLTGAPHSLSAIARSPTTAATLDARDIHELTRQRPDIALVLYRNLARAVGAKLRALDAVYARDVLESPP